MGFLTRIFSRRPKVKLAKREVPKIAETIRQRIQIDRDGNRLEVLHPGEGPDREHVERVLSLIDRAHRGEPVRMRIDREKGEGMRALSIRSENSNLVYSDDKGSLELMAKGGEKTLTAKNPKGETVFSGPVATPEQRKAMPADLRERLEKLESMLAGR